MTKYRITFSRTYTITEGFDRVIDAPSEAEAMAAANNLASEFDEDCPDDCSEDERGHTELGDFYPGLDATMQVDLANVSADYSIGLDGQCVACGE